METNRPNILKFATLTTPKLPQNSIVNKDGNTLYIQDAELIRLLSKGFQAQYEILIPPDNGAGTRQPNGNWSGKIGMVMRSEADIAMGGLFITEERYQVLNFTFPPILSRITFMTDRPQPVSKNMAIFYPFSYEVWITISLLFATVSLLFYVLMNKKKSLRRVLLVTAGSMLQQPLDFKMKTNALRIITFTWILGVMIISHSYKAVLLSFLSFPTLSGIREIHELSKASTESSFKCFTYKGSYLVGYFLETQDATWKAIGNCLNRNKLETGDVFEAFRQVGFKKAFIGSSYTMASYANDYFISEDSFSIGLGGIPFSRNFCCPDRLHAIIHRIVASGLLNKIKGDDDFRSRLHRKSFETQVSETAMKINLDDVSGAFYILISGWLLSFIVLIAEVLTVRYTSPK